MMYGINFNIHGSYFELELDDGDLVLNQQFSQFLFDERDLSFYSKGVLLVLAIYMDKQDNSLSGSIKEIRKRLRISQYRIHKLMDELKDNNLIKVTDNKLYVNPLLFFSKSVSVETCKLFSEG